MRVVVADTSPIDYLVLLSCVEVLQQLYGQVVIPAAVFRELSADGAPAEVAAWVRTKPEWLAVRAEDPSKAPEISDLLASIDAGEAEAIRIAAGEVDSLLLIDDAAGRAVAARLGVTNTGPLGVLVAAGQAGIIDLRTMLDRLKQTNFRVSGALLDRLLDGTPDRS